MGYEIVSFTLSAEASMNVLSSSGRPSFMDDLADDPKKRQRAVLIARAAEKVARNGIGWARSSKTLKPITARLSVFELRVPGKTIRVMTYLHDGVEPIYLFDFDGHHGKDGKIPPSIIEKAHVLAEAARTCMIGESS